MKLTQEIIENYFNEVDLDTIYERFLANSYDLPTYLINDMLKYDIVLDDAILSKEEIELIYQEYISKLRSRLKDINYLSTL
jgi:hypothetical protein